MFTKTFSKDSWMYRLLAWPGAYVNPPKNICALRTALLLKVFGILLCCTAGFLYVFSITTTLIYKIFPGYITGWFLTQVAIAGGVLFLITLCGIAFVALVFGIVWLVQWYGDYRRKNYKFKEYKKPEPWAITTLYKSWKDKTCYKVNFQ